MGKSWEVTDPHISLKKSYILLRDLELKTISNTVPLPIFFSMNIIKEDRNCEPLCLIHLISRINGWLFYDGLIGIGNIIN